MTAKPPMSSSPSAPVTRDEWNAVLDSEPVTPNQRGAIIRECNRLGLGDRAERLAVLAALLGLDRLGSTADLTQGQGGQLVGILSAASDRAELPDVAAPAVDVQGVTLAEALQPLLTVIAIAIASRHLNYAAKISCLTRA